MHTGTHVHTRGHADAHREARAHTDTGTCTETRGRTRRHTVTVNCRPLFLYMKPRLAAGTSDPAQHHRIPADLLPAPV